MKRKIEIIKRFAKDMGYEIEESRYNYHNRPCYMIELIGTSDSEGNYYSWAWYIDKEEEIWW